MNHLRIATLLLQSAATLTLVGLIWFVQIVHYPLFARVGDSQFVSYEVDHQRLTARVVAPLMLAEIAAATLLVWSRPPGVSRWPTWVGLVLIVTIWLLTVLVHVPQHTALALSFDARVQQDLVRDNWWRTGAWTARGLLVLFMLGEALGHGLNHADWANCDRGTNNCFGRIPS